MRFKDKLMSAITTLGLSQIQVAQMTGIGPASISMYLKGLHEPPDKKKRQIALALGLDEDYFNRDVVGDELRIMESDGEIPSLSVEKVARLLGMCHVTVRKGLQQGVFPWGYAIKTSENRWAYFINAAKFEAIEMPYRVQSKE